VPDPAPPSLTYRDAGVDIAAGDALVERIKPLAARTRRPELLAGVGGFGALLTLPEGLREPVLVAGTDGVGTKLLLARDMRRFDTVGVDLVAMCANDVLCHGAAPLAFLDYYATGKLAVDEAAEVVRGIAQGCQLAGAVLAGGETAELPGLYAPGDFDLAGFCVGVVERAQIVDGRGVAVGDALIGIASSGVHSNGYSLVRRVLAGSGTPLDAPFAGRTLGEVLLEPTRIYVRAVLAALDTVPVHAIAHITGGGLPGNVPRVLPDGLGARIDASAFPRPPVFAWLQQAGGVAADEMWRTFNCGIGMVLVVPPDAAARTLEVLEHWGETAWRIGAVMPVGEGRARVEIHA
jgi:phosphoribosylformylglycinamidine cyclo-ligase